MKHKKEQKENRIKEKREEKRKEERTGRSLNPYQKEELYKK